MTKTTDITNLIASHSDRNKSDESPNTSLNAIVLKMTREQRRYAEHIRKMTELKRMASFQERIVHRMLDKGIEETGQPERPHLKIVK
jgi:hypothetical protein